MRTQKWLQSYRRVNGIPRLRHRLSAVSQYAEVVAELLEIFGIRDLWYRGVPSEAYRLVPAIFRKSVWEYDQDFAQRIFDEFARRGKPYAAESHAFNRWHWYHAMQHHGLPTRLLDWSLGALIALYFAVRPPFSGAPPSVFVLNPHWLDRSAHSRNPGLVFGPDPVSLDDWTAQVLEAYFAPRQSLPEFPLCIEPPHTSSRIAAQRSVFSIHGRRIHAFEELARKAHMPMIAQISFAPSSARHILYDLRTLGIAEASLFPDLDGLSRELRFDFGMH